MRTLHRYILVTLGIIVYFWLLLADFEYSDENPIEEEEVSFWTNEPFIERVAEEHGDTPCSMHKCFNFTRCLGEFPKVYVYPNSREEPISGAYLKILTSIRVSAYFTSDPSEACLFVLAIDTTDRDKISENYVRDVNNLIASLPAEIWNEGSNHVIFNLYHGTFPDYADHNLGFNTGKALIARASPSVQHFRFGFDVSFPLFHKEHDLRGRIERTYNLKHKDQYLVSFKGKRYVYGIGSETRDALHHLHNGDTVAMVTTCRHNNDWKEHQDARCARDNEEYDKWDYVSTMANSTFCLAPRGRRLGSFRFLESLRLGCIPVVLSDDWVLPYAEVIDWTEAAVVMTEDNVLLVPDVLYTFSPSRILRMKQRCRFLYNRYFKDVESITIASLEIIFDRVRKSEMTSTRSWNRRDTPQIESSSPVSVVIRAAARASGRLQNLMNVLSKHSQIDGIQVLWPTARGVPPSGADFGIATLPRPQFVTIDNQTSLLHILHDVNGPILYVDERLTPTKKEIGLALLYIGQFPDRIIGLHGADYNIISSTVSFSRTYNTLFPSLIMFHSCHLRSLTSLLPPALSSDCLFVSLNIMASTNSLQPPMVIGNRSKEDWMNAIEEQPCWQKVSERWPEGPSLFYSDLRYI